MYSKGPVSWRGKSIGLWGPEPVLQYHGEIFKQAVNYDVPKLIMPWDENFFFLENELTTRGNDVALNDMVHTVPGRFKCFKRGEREVDCTFLVFCSPESGRGECEVSMSDRDFRILESRVIEHTSRIPIPLTSILRLGDTRPFRGYSMMTGSMMVETLKRWARWLAGRPLEAFVIDSWARYSEQLIHEAERTAERNGVPVERIIGMTGPELRAQAQEFNREVVMGMAATAGAAVTAILSAVYGPLGALVGSIATSLLEWGAAALPLAAGCSWTRPIFIYRTSDAEECRIDPESSARDIVGATRTTAAAVDIDLKDPFDTTEEDGSRRRNPKRYRDDVTIEEPSPYKNLIVGTAGAAAGAGLVYLLKR